MTGDIMIGAMLIVFGAFVIFAMFKNWDFMFDSTAPGHRKFNLLVRVLGRGTVRVLYSLLGLFIVFLGVMGVSGMVQLVNPK